MRIDFICPKSWGSNCYLLIGGNEAFVVDPSPSAEVIIECAEKNNVTLRGILLTHAHFDHVLSAEELHNAAGIPVMLHEDDADALNDPKKNAYYSFFKEERSFRPADILLRDNEILQLGGEQIRVLHTPGHTPGSVCLLTDSFIVTGDTLFAQGFGRVDLPGGRLHDMKHSLERLNELDHSLAIYPGHDGFCSLGDALSKIRFLRH